MKVIDASVVLKWFVTEVRKEAADAWLDSGTSMTAPELLLVEVANASRRKVRLGDLEVDEAEDIVATTPSLVELVQDRHDVSAALRLAVELDHPVYDCLYLARALRIDAQVVTDDEPFHRAVVASDHAGRTLLLEADNR